MGKSIDWNQLTQPIQETSKIVSSAQLSHSGQLFKYIL